MRSLVACALILAPFTFAPAYAASVVPNVGQSADGIIAVRSGRYARKNCTPVNGPYGFYGSIFCRPNDQEYMRNLGSNWPQKEPRYYRPYKYYKPRR
ncbi:MAG: hypothetical protein ACR2OF_09310 [Hyphomicrobium sp.]